MQRFKRSLFLVLFSTLCVLSTIIGLLIPYFSEQNALKQDAYILSSTIAKQAEKSNALSIVNSYEGQTKYELTIFSIENQFSFSTLNNLGDASLHALKNKTGTYFIYQNDQIEKGIGFGYVTYNIETSVYVFATVSYTNSYLSLKYSAIFVPIIVTLLLSLFIIIDYKKKQASAIYLKNQVRKLRAIAKIDTMVEYDNDIENLANVVKDTRKQIEASVKNNYISEKKIRFILDSIEQGILVFDSKLKIVLSNNKGRDIMNLSKHDAFLSSDEFTSDIIVNARVLMKTNRQMVFTKEKEGIIYEFNLNSVENEFGSDEKENLVSLLVVDVTEKYNSEKMKRDFFANAAHELKSPLTSILGFQELINEGVLTSKEDLEMVNNKTLKEGERMKKLIMEMINLSSLENNNLRAIEKIDVTEAIENIVSMLEDQILSKKIQLIKRYQKLIIKMNPDDFYNLFKNLIENAIRYNKEGGTVEIIVNIENHYIRIRDTGIGIKDDDKVRIFERFYRVDKARSKENGGTGLGLSIVKYICNYYGFKINVDSALGIGSSFTIYY